MLCTATDALNITLSP